MILIPGIRKTNFEYQTRKNIPWERSTATSTSCVFDGPAFGAWPQEKKMTQDAVELGYETLSLAQAVGTQMRSLMDMRESMELVFVEILRLERCKTTQI